MTTKTSSTGIRKRWWAGYPTWSAAVVLTVTSLFGVWTYLDSRHASADDVKAMKKQVQQYQLRTTRSLTSIELSNLYRIIEMQLAKPVGERDEALIYKTQQQIDRLMVDFEILSQGINKLGDE